MTEKFKVMTLNAENMYLFLDKHKGPIDLASMTESRWQGSTSSIFENKPFKKVQLLAQLFNYYDPDLMMLTEIGGEESLQNFNKLFLQNKYDVYMAPSNSDRGIDLAFLLKKKWSSFTSLKHYQHYPLPHPTFKYFSRNLLHLEIVFSKVPWNFFLVHLKSKLDIEKKDFEGRSRRAAEILAIRDILLPLINLKPCLLSGDFNAQVLGPLAEPETFPLTKELMLKDVTEISLLKEEECFSYFYFDSKGHRWKQHIDYALFNAIAEPFIIPQSICLPSFINESGLPLMHPNHESQKRLLPSDHYPIYFELKI